MAGLSIWHVLIFAIVVIEMQSVLGLSDEKVDELWEYALNL